MNMKLALIVILSTAAVVFIAQNATVVEVDFLYWKAALSSALLLFFTLLIGFLLGWFVHGYLLYRKARADPFYLR